MDVGYYISELLGQHGDVNVPGLGYFAHTRVNGYYNDSEGKFYPPGHSVQFDPQYLDHDDALALYIAQKKKISLASSKYFTDKFVQTLKQQAVAGEAALADLGWFSINNTSLHFRPNSVTGTDPEFFGYPVIPLQKIGTQTVEPQYMPQPEAYAAQPVLAEQVPQVSSDAVEDEEAYEHHLVDQVEKKRRGNFWLFATLAIALAAGGIYLTYRYNPTAFSFFTQQKEPQPVAPKVIVVEDDTTKQKVKPDSDSIPVVRKVSADSLVKTDTVKVVNPAPVKSSAGLPRFEIIVASAYDMKEATGVILNFKKKGLDPKIVTDAPGKRIKVSVGTFATRGLAEDRRRELLTAKKIGKDAYSLPILPEKTAGN